MKCLSCGKSWQLDGQVHFCPYCGTPLPSEKRRRKCPVCRAEMQAGFLCGSCGFDFSSCMEIYDTFTLPVKTIRSIADSRYEFETKSERLRVPLRRFAGKTETPHVHNWVKSKEDTTKCRICGIGRYRLSAEEFEALSDDYEDAREIKFLRMDVQNAPESAHDVSAAEDGSILAWLDKGTLMVASDGIIAANEDSRALFYGFDSVQTIQFNDCFDTSDVEDMSAMFSGCSSLTQVDLSGFETSNVEDMSAMFSGCSSLALLDLSNFDTSNVTNMYQMFDHCSSLIQLDLSGFDTSNVTNISMFFGCYSLRQLDLSGFDTSEVTDMSEMFFGCSSLTQLNLSNFVTSNVTDMSNMFFRCSRLARLDISGFDTSKVTNMRGMFYYCEKLTAKGLLCSDSKIRAEYNRR